MSDVINTRPYSISLAGGAVLPAGAIATGVDIDVPENKALVEDGALLVAVEPELEPEPKPEPPKKPRAPRQKENPS